RAAPSAACHLLRAQIHHLSSRKDRALEEIDDALRINKNVAVAWYWRGVIRDLPDTTETKNDFKEALRLEFKGPDLMIRLARLAAMEGASDEVLRLTGKALESPTPCEDEFLAMSLAQRGESVSEATRSLRVFAHAYRGRGYFQKAEYPASLKECDSALSLDVKNWVARYHRGLALYQLADYDAAIAEFSQLIALDDRDYRAYAARGSAHLRKNNKPSAKEDYDKALQHAPLNWDQRQELEANR